MASPPFDIAQTSPANGDIVALYPGVERTYRDVVESWLLSISTTYGYPRVPTLTTAQRDAETNWGDGNMIYNDTLGRWQVTTSIDPDVWVSIGPEFSSGTRVVLAQTSAPTGYTKVSDAAYNDAALRMVTGSVTPTAGSVAFTTAFASQAVAGTISATALTAAQLPAHDHFMWVSNSGGTGDALITAANYAPVIGQFGGDDFRYRITGIAGPATLGLTSSVGSGGTHTHTLTGTAINLAVKYVDVCLFQKD